MPSMLTHRVLGDDVIKQLNPSSTLMQAIDRNFELYSIGTSGPDIFFFYRPFPWTPSKNAENISHMGSLMHQYDTKEMFRIMIKRCKTSMDPMQIAYTAGVLLHWGLDHIAHPYVYNRTGWGNASNMTHRFFESQLDRGIIDWKGIDIRSFKPQDVVKYMPDTWYPIWQLYSEVLEKIWKIQLKPEDMELSLRDFRKLEEYAYDPKGNRMKMIFRIEKAAGTTGHATSMIIPLKMDPAWNVMNEGHGLWHHPSTGEERRESFKEMFERAAEESVALMNAFAGYLENDLPADHVLEHITGNFHTGLPVKDDMKYFDLVPTRIPGHLF